MPAPTFAQIQAAAAPGCPLVYFAVTPAGTVVLIVPAQPCEGSEPSQGSGVYPVWCDLTEDDLLDLLVQGEGESISGYLPAQFGQASMHAALKDLLPALGARLMTPLAQQLRQLGASGATLIPGGLLSLLPLGTAISSPPGGGREGASFLDEFDVSYAPSALALAQSCRQLAQRDLDPGRHRLLAVGDPPHGDAQRLPYAAAEVQDIAPYYPAEGRRLLCEEQATYAAVEAAAPEATVLHFACHGQFDPDNPLDSALLLAGDDRLTLAGVLGELSPQQVRLVVLSACQTAISDYNNLPDEVIGLPAGFMSAGAPGVLGSLWPVNDISTALLMERFYYFYREQGQPPAVALGAAQRWLRDVTNQELSQVFQGRMEMATDRSRMAYTLAQEKFARHTTRNPQGKPFAAPRFWAAFTFHGV